MVLNDSSEVIYFDDTPISVAEQISLGFPRNMRCYAKNVVKINGKYYYAKRCFEDDRKKDNSFKIF